MYTDPAISTQRHLGSCRVGEDLRMSLHHIHIPGPSLALALEELWVGRAESRTVRGKKAFRFHSGVKISLLNKYHFSKATALLLGTLMTSFEVD